MMENPWREVGDVPPFLCPPDKPYIDAFNRDRPTDDPYRLETNLVLPSPVLGFRDSMVVVLEANPWLSEGAVAQFDDSSWRQAALEGLHSDKGTVFLGLEDRWSELQGGRWWRRCFKGVRDAGHTYEDLARRVMSVDFHGYFSKNWSGLPVTLPSQHYGFDLVDAAIDRGAVIVLMRATRHWRMAVPRLNEYEDLVVARNPQVSSISEGNLTPEGWSKVLRALNS